MQPAILGHPILALVSRITGKYAWIAKRAVNGVLGELKDLIWTVHGVRTVPIMKRVILTKNNAFIRKFGKNVTAR